MPGDLLRISDLTPTTPLKIDYSDGSISLSVEDVLKWVAPGAPPNEAMRLLVISRMCRLDPFRKEIHLVPFTSKKTGVTTWTLVIDKAGWLRMAETHPQFDGHESGIVLRNLESGEMTEVDGEIVPNGWGVVGGWAKVYRKDRRFPTVSRVGSECVRDGNPQWETQMPMMYRKTALVHSLRESGLCFGLGGIYDRGEVPYTADVATPERLAGRPTPAIEADYVETPMPSLNPALATGIRECLDQLGASDYEVQVMLSKRGVANIAELSDSEGREMLAKLQTLLDQQQAGEIMLPDAPEVAGDVSLEDGEYVDEHGEIRSDRPGDVEARQLEEEIAAMDGNPMETLFNVVEQVAMDTAESLGMDIENIHVSVGNDDETPPDIVRNFGIEETPDESDVPDVVRPEAAPKKSRKKAKA